MESILTNVEWFFECDDTDVPNFEEGGDADVDMEVVMNNLTSGSGISQSNDALNEISNTMGSHSQLLLSNLQKLEESGKVGVNCCPKEIAILAYVMFNEGSS